MNPYQPPPNAIQNETDRNQCPVCQARVMFLRFVLPLNRCSNCRTYLTIRESQASRTSSALVFVAIYVAAVLLENTDRFQALSISRYVLVAMILISFLRVPLTGELKAAVLFGFMKMPGEEFDKLREKRQAENDILEPVANRSHSHDVHC